MQRVAEVYQQLQTEIQDPQLPAAAAAELVRHMLQLQAEGLAVAQGQDPLALLLAAREEQFAAAMQAVASEHERAVNRLRAAVAAAATDEKMQVCISCHRGRFVLRCMWYFPRTLQHGALAGTFALGRLHMRFRKSY